MPPPVERAEVRAPRFAHTSWPFAQDTVGSVIRHSDLNAGLVETMAEIGQGAIVAAVANS